MGNTMLNVPRWRPGKLARNSSSLLVWMALRAAAQAGIVVLLARQLSAQPYGQFVAIIAVASFFTPFVGVGLSNMLLRNSARDPSHDTVYLARAVRWWARSLLPCIAIAIAIATLLLPSGLPLGAAFAVIAAELSATSLTDLGARHKQAQHRINTFGAINAGLPITRLIAFSILFLTAPKAQLPTVLWIYAGCSIIYTLFMWFPVRSAIAGADSAAPEAMTPTSGLPFSLAAFATKLQAEFNKPILAHAGFGLAGSYNVGQRAVDMATLPLTALQESLWPRLYAQQDPMRQLRRTGLILLAIALALGVVLWAAAPALPYVLGPSFTDAVSVLRMLALLPLLQSFRYLVNFYVIHHVWMRLIGRAYTVGAVASVALVTALVPRWGINGAVAAAYLTEVAMTTTLLVEALRKQRS